MGPIHWIQKIKNPWKLATLQKTKTQENFHPSHQNFGKLSIQNECVIKIINIMYVKTLASAEAKVLRKLRPCKFR